MAMAVTHVTAVRDSLANLIDDEVNGGTTNLEGRLVFMTSADVEVATLLMSNPAFGAASSGVITANTITDDTSATGGEAALFKLVDRDEVEVLRGTVGTSGADINLSSTTIGAGDTVSISSLTYEASL